MKILLLSDSLTYTGLSLEDVSVFPLLPYPAIYKFNPFYHPDVIIVESAWFGYRDLWHHKLVNFSDKKNKLNELLHILEWAKTKKIPCVFWNKEDPIHFDKFLECAQYFDLIATTDNDCVDKYKNQLGRAGNVIYLPFAIQPKIHFYKDKSMFNRMERGVFMGSYLRNTHIDRKKWQDMVFPICAKHGLDIYDRNSNLKKKNYAFPKYDEVRYFSSVPYLKTGEVLRNYRYSINVNTITESSSMFSRRLLESLACGNIVITNPSKAVDNIFKDFVVTINNEDELNLNLERILYGDLSFYKKRIEEAQFLIMEKFTYQKWLSSIFDALF